MLEASQSVPRPARDWQRIPQELRDAPRFWDWLSLDAAGSILLLDKDCRVLFANGRSLRTLGLTRDQALGQPLCSLLVEPAATEICETAAKAHQLNRPMTLLVVVRGKFKVCTVFPLATPVGQCRNTIVHLCVLDHSRQSLLDAPPPQLGRAADWGSFETLSPRELEVLYHIGLGLSDRAIADRLCRSVHTAQHHRGSLGRKLGVSARPRLATLAQESGLTSLLPHELTHFVELKRVTGGPPEDN